MARVRRSKNTRKVIARKVNERTKARTVTVARGEDPDRAWKAKEAVGAVKKTAGAAEFEATTAATAGVERLPGEVEKTEIRDPARRTYLEELRLHREEVARLLGKSDEEGVEGPSEEVQEVMGLHSEAKELLDLLYVSKQHCPFMVMVC